MNFDDAYDNLYQLIKTKDEEGCLEALQGCPELLISRAYVGESLLHFTAYADLPKVIEYVISQGMDRNAASEDGTTPLRMAAQFGAVRAARCLIEHGAEVNARDMGPSPLTAAVTHGSEEIVKLLIDHGADVNATYVAKSGQTVNPLSFAEDYVHHEIPALLRQHGAVMPDRSKDLPGPRTFRDDVLDHFQTHVGTADKLALHEMIPLGIVSVSVHIIPPAEERPFRTLFTTGVCEVPLTAPPGKEGLAYAELMIKVTTRWRVDRESVARDERSVWPVHWLQMCAHTIHDNGVWLGEGEIVVGPKKVPENWPFAGFLVMPSEIPKVTCMGSRDVTIYSIKPIYEHEITLAREEGVGKLIADWIASGAGDVYDEERCPLVR